MSLRLSLLVLRVSDPVALAAFYTEALGVAFETHCHGNGPEHFAAVLEDALVFEIYPLKESGSPGTRGLRFGFAVESVAESYAACRAAGARTMMEPRMTEWGLRAVVDDPAGHRIELTAATPA